MLQRGGFVAANYVATALLNTSSSACATRAAAGCIAQTRQLSTASPSFTTEQDRKNYEVLQYLSQRPVDTAFRIGALAGLGVAMRDLSLVLNSIYQKDVRGIDHPEIAAQEVKNTINFLQSLDRAGGQEVKEQLTQHIARIIPELNKLASSKGHATARRKVALCSKQDQEVIHRLFPALLGPAPGATPSTLAAGDEGAAAAAATAASDDGDIASSTAAADADEPHSLAASTSGSDPSATAAPSTELAVSSSGGGGGSSAFADDLSSAAALAREARILHASGRFARVRFPVWDVTRLDDAPVAGQTLRPRHMNRLPWMALMPPHLEVSYQTMTAIPLFPMQEAVYPEFVDFDYAMYYLSRFTRRYKRSRSRVRSPRR